MKSALVDSTERNKLVSIGCEGLLLTALEGHMVERNMEEKDFSMAAWTYKEMKSLREYRLRPSG